jgi:DNA-binding IscR family transcriptional regulator
MAPMATSSRPKDLYTEAHLLVAAIRVHEHLQSQPATLEDACRMLGFSTEHAGIICRRLVDLGVLESVTGSFGARLFIRDHLKIEEIPRGEVGRKLEDEVKKFQDLQRHFTQKIESLQAEQTGKKKSLFAEMEKKLKEEIEKKSKTPI